MQDKACINLILLFLDKDEVSYADRPDVHTPAQNISTIKKSDSVSFNWTFQIVNILVQKGDNLTCIMSNQKPSIFYSILPCDDNDCKDG